MKDCTLDFEAKTAIGSNINRRFRREGKIPAVMYHRGEESHPALLNERQFIQMAKSVRSSQVIRSRSSDKALNDRSLLVKQIQRDYQTDKVLHVDFQILSDNDEIHVDIPLTFVGEAPGVKLDGGILTVVAHEITVSCLPKSIPENITVDISELRIGQSIHAAMVKLPENVKLHVSPELTIVSVVQVRAEVEAAAAAATPAEGDAAAATAEGAAAAAPAADADAAKAKK